MGRQSKRKKFKRIQETRQFTSGVSIPKSQGTSRSGVLFLVGVIRWCAYAALFAPLIVHPSFFFPFVVPKTVFFWIFSEIMFAVWLLLAIPNKEFRPKWNPISIALSAFLAVTIFTSFTGINIERSFWSTFERMAGTMNWLHLGIFFLVLGSTFKNLGDWKKLVTVSFIAANIVSLLFLFDRVGIRLIPFETRTGATIGNSSFMAAYLLFHVFFGIWLFTKAKEEWQKILYGIGLSLLILSMFLSTAYGALTSMLGGFFLVFLSWLFFSAKIPYAKHAAIFFLLTGLFIVGIIGYGTMTQNKDIVGRLPYFFSDTGTIGARKVVWEMALQGIKERPILGWGPENFNVVFTKYFNPCLVLSKCGGEVWFDRTHNVILDHLIHSGIAGLLSYFSIFIALGFTAFRFVAKTREWLLPSVIIAALLSYFVQNLLVFDMPSTYLMFAFTTAFAAAGFSLNGTQGEIKGSKGRDGVMEPPVSLDSPRFSLRSPSPFSIVVTGVLLFYFLFSFGIQSFQDAHWGIIINRSRMPPEKQLELYKKSLSVSPIGNRQVPEFFTNNMVNRLYGDSKLPAGFVEEVGKIMEGIVRQNPIDFRDYLIMGNFYAAAKEYNPEYLNRAEEFLKKAVELSPQNQQGYTSLGQVYFMKGEEDRRILMLKKAMELEPLYERGQFNLAEAYLDAERFAEAREVYERLFKGGFIPEDLATLSKVVRMYDALKDYASAIVWLKEVIYSKPVVDNGDAHFYLADLYKKAGNKEEARKEALEAKRLNSSFQKEIEEFLKELK